MFHVLILNDQNNKVLDNLLKVASLYLVAKQLFMKFIASE